MDDAHPPMWHWYRRYYTATEHSKAHATFCERLFGRDFCQHGFADMQQLHLLLEVAHLGPNNRVLELGCGNGFVAEYLSDLSGAHVTGIDYVPEAIAQAQERTRSRAQHLVFQVANMEHIDFSPQTFDTVIAVDTLYFTDLDETIRQMKVLLLSGGQMVILYSHGADPENPIETFPKETLPPDKTPLAKALQKHGLSYQTWDLTDADYRHAQRKKQIAGQLRPQFEAEGNLFLYENRHGEAEGVMAAIEAGAHARYLYHVLKSE